MKKIQGILTIAAFAVAIGGAFASNPDAFTDAFRSDGCTPVNKPALCASTNPSDPVCTIGTYTYYQDSGCLNAWHMPQP